MYEVILRSKAAQVAFLLMVATLVTQNGCKRKTVPAVDGNLNLTGDCSYSGAIGQKSINITIRGNSWNNSGYLWSTNVAGKSSDTYPVKIPSKGTFNVTVDVTEAGKPCKWTDEAKNQTAAPINMSLKMTEPKTDCGC